MADKNLSHRLKTAPGAKAVGILPVDMELGQLSNVDDSAKAEGFVIKYNNTTQKYEAKADVGLTQAQVDARIVAGVEPWARDDSTAIPAGKLTNVPTGITQAQVDARVVAGTLIWARAGNTDKIPSSKLPTILTQAQVDARVVAGTQTWARAGNNDKIPSGKLPTILTQAQVDARIVAGVQNWARDTTTQIPLSKLGNAPSGGGGGLSQAQVDARVVAGTQTWARATNTDRIPKTKLPTDWLTQSQVDARIVSWARVGSSATVPSNRLPTILTQAQVDARVVAGTLIWARAGNTDDIPLNKLGNAPGLTQAQVDARVVAGTQEWARNGNNSLIPAGKLTNAPGLTQSEVDARVVAGTQTWARAGNNDEIPSGKLPTILTQAQVDARVVAGVQVWARDTTTQIPLNKLGNAPSGGGGGLSQAQVDARVVAGTQNWARDTTTLIPANKLTNAPGLTQSEVDARIVSWARAGSSATIPTNRLPTILTQAQVDARVVAGTQTWARAGNTDEIPSGKLPTILTQAQVDARVVAGTQTWARAGNNDEIPSSKLPTILTQAQVDARVVAGVQVWARDTTTQIPANKLNNAPRGLNQIQVDERVKAGTADWAETDNTDQIPKDKLRNVGVRESIDDFSFNDALVLRDFNQAGMVNEIELPDNFATDYRYLVFGTHVNAEYGIFDTKYLNAQPGATVSDESGTYTFTKATSTAKAKLSGQIKGAYLYRIDSENILEENDWLRSPRNNQNQPTTSANDGQGGIDIAKATADKYNYFAFRVWGPGTLQFLPKAVYDMITAGQNRVFLVWDEANTKTIRVSRSAGNYEFDAYNKATNSEVNEARSMAFLNFAKENILVNDADATDTTLTLPQGYNESDLLVAVTKNSADDFYKVWTIRTKFTDAPNNRITEATRIFNPAASIIYASLINVHSFLDIKAKEVSTDDTQLENLEGKNVQAVLEDIDEKIAETVSDTPKRVSMFPTTPKEGEEIYLTDAVVAKGPDIQTESFSSTFLDGEGWGTFGFCNYHDTQGTLFSLGHTSQPLPTGVFIVSNKNIVVADGTNSDYLAVVVVDKDGTRHARKLTYNNRNNYEIVGADHSPHVDSYSYNADLPAGPWHELYFLRTGGSGASETINANTDGIGSAAVTGKVTDAVSFSSGPYIRKDSIWQARDYNAVEADIDKSLKFTAEETLPGGPQSKNVPFVASNALWATPTPFPGINLVYYDPRTSGDTARRWAVVIPPNTPDEEYPVAINFDGTILSLHFFQTDRFGGTFITQPTSRVAQQLSSAISKPINIQLANGLWLGQSGEKKVNKTLDKDALSSVARRIPRLVNLPAVEYGVAGQMFYLLETKTVRGNAILTPAYISRSSIGLDATHGSLTPSSSKIVEIKAVTPQGNAIPDLRNKFFIEKSTGESAFTKFYINGVEHDVTVVTNSVGLNRFEVTDLNGNSLREGQKYAVNVMQAAGWIYPDVELPKDKYIIWNGYQFVETHLALKDYAARGSTDPIPKDEFSTTISETDFNALTLSQLKPNHVYWTTV